MNDQELEDIQKARNLTAPRVTLPALLDNIAGEHYFTLEQATAGAPAPRLGDRAGHQEHRAAGTDARHPGPLS